MLALLSVLILLEPEPAKEPEPQPTPAVDPIAEKFCEGLYKKRVAKIAALAHALDDLKNKYDFDQLSTAARNKIEKPLRDQIARARANRQIDWDILWPTDAEPDQVFMLQVTNKKFGINEHWIKEVEIDKSTILARNHPRAPSAVGRYGGRTEWLIVTGLSTNDYSAEKWSSLKLKGTFVRIEDLKYQNRDVIQIARWNHRDAVLRIWPKYLKEAEERDAKKQDEEK